jgi:predicted TIM-barrel fold metal-dependent hydrolase
LATAREADWLWSAAERANVPLMISQSPELFSDVRNIAEKHPELKLAIDHFAVVRHKKDDAAFANVPSLVALAKWPNISVKVSALPCYSSEDYPYRGIHKYIRQVFDAFGPERMFWGTDLTRLPCTYRQAITLFTDELPWLTTEDKELIMGKALCQWLGWPLPDDEEN